MIFRTFLLKCNNCFTLNITRNILNLSKNYNYRTNSLPNVSNAIVRKNSTLDVNTNVVKDVILYKYDNPKKFKMLNVFALCQFFFWGYLSYIAHTTLKDAPVVKPDPNAPWWRRINLGENKYRNGITFLAFFMGYGILAVAWMFSLKSVRYLILRKGGNAVTFVTYGPFGKNRMMTVNLKHVSCQQTRDAATSYIPIKVEKQYLHYILDLNGEFRNKQLFDATAGLKRKWLNQI